MHISKFLRIAFLFMIVSCFTTVASAKKDPPRFTLWIHGQSEPFANSKTTLKADLAITGSDFRDPDGYMYAGPEFRISNFVYLDVMAGVMTQDQFIASPRLIFVREKFSTWSLVEFYSKEKNGYWFQMVDYQVLPWLKTGAEYESWGSWAHPGQISHGAGPHVSLVFDHTTLDVAFQARRDPTTGSWGEGFWFRYHVFAFK